MIQRVEALWRRSRNEAQDVVSNAEPRVSNGNSLIKKTQAIFDDFSESVVILGSDQRSILGPVQITLDGKLEHIIIFRNEDLPEKRFVIHVQGARESLVVGENGILLEGETRNPQKLNPNDLVVARYDGLLEVVKQVLADA